MEMARTLNALSRGLGLHVNKNPSGTYGYVGSVPAELAYVDATPEQVKIAREFGPRLARVVNRTFATEQEAVDYAAERGYTAKTPVKRPI